MALPDLTGQNIQNTYQRVVQKGENGQLFDGTGSLIPLQIDGPDLIVSGAIRANSYIVSESIINITSGSTAFGNSSDDTHTFTGNVKISQAVSVVGNEGYKFSADSDTFIYQQGPNNITLHAGNEDVLDVNPTGVSIIGNFNATIDGGSF